MVGLTDAGDRAATMASSIVPLLSMQFLGCSWILFWAMSSLRPSGPASSARTAYFAALLADCVRLCIYLLSVCHIIYSGNVAMGCSWVVALVHAGVML